MSKYEKRPKSRDMSKLEKISKSRDIAKTEKLPTCASRDRSKFEK